jgi:hypothetical protein
VFPRQTYRGVVDDRFSIPPLFETYATFARLSAFHIQRWG